MSEANSLSLASEADRYLTFMLGGGSFALPLLSIREIIEYTGPTPVPMMPRYVRGVINLRGAVVPVFDLWVRFGKERAELTRRTCLIIIELPQHSEHRQIGIVVDAVNSVVDIPSENIEPPPRFGTHIASEFIHGMGKIDGSFVVLLDAAHIVSADELPMPAPAVNM